MPLSLVIPSYNEEKNREKIVGGLVNNVEKASIDSEVIFVNNGSVYRSPQILEKLAKEKPNRIKVVHER